jgi:SlyX protein
VNEELHPARITELEIGLAHQQRLCEQLNEVVTSHTREIMQLERLVGELKKQLNEVRNQPKPEPALPQDEKPPHY